MPATLTPQEFVAKWRAVVREHALSRHAIERKVAQSHFIDLCRLAGHSEPVEADPRGEWFTFEAGADKVTGGSGAADVWKRGFFALEYKGPDGDLEKAYRQLLLYREALQNPPLLVVSDIGSIAIHTNFTNTVKQTYTLTLDDLLTPHGFQTLRNLFFDPEAFRPGRTTAYVTEEAARRFAELARHLDAQGHDAHRIAHFSIRLLFCLFAEDVRLLPKGLFTRLVDAGRRRPGFDEQLRLLFAAMATGGYYGEHEIPHFDGGLFNDAAVLPLDSTALGILHSVAGLDWSSIEPSIFGTLFTRSLDPARRAQLGAQYTSKEDILLIVEPVLMEPLRRAWEAVKATARGLLEKRRAATPTEIVSPAERTRLTQQRTRLNNELDALLSGFAGRLRALRVLDPACGSGNFLYVALNLLLDLEKEVITFYADAGLSPFYPQVSPAQLYGIEVNEYAHELAQATVQIGYLQWLHHNGLGTPAEPILKPLDTIREMDAILAYDAAGNPVEPEWPEADVIVGNPPFLGNKSMREKLGDRYVENLRALYAGRLPGSVDLVTYWFERAREEIAHGRAKRAGLLATQAIRSGTNRTVLDRIKESGDIFYAQADRPWILDDAAVRVSMVGFDDGSEQRRLINLDKEMPADQALKQATLVASINADLTVGIDIRSAKKLAENSGICFQGPVKVGPFELEHSQVEGFMSLYNPHGRPNSDVVRPWINASDITHRPRGMYIVDFGDLPMKSAALYEAPFEYVRSNVKPMRDENNRAKRREYWWQHGETVPGLRASMAGLHRFAATPRVAKHRLFVWVDSNTLPDSRVYAFARDDDYFFGVLHSRLHEVWSLATSSRHGVGNDPTYNNTTCFETFPFPWPPGTEPPADPRVQAIGDAARELVALRDAWLNPPGASEAELKKRTLTNLYNARPAWLDLAHRALDRAVFAAYGWPEGLADEEILERLLALNLERVVP